MYRLLLLVFLLTTVPVLGADKLVVDCRATTETITVDGKLTEKVWSESEPLRFYIPVTHDKPVSLTEAWIVHDETAVYVAFRADDRDLKAEQFGDDATVYKDDCLEFFFKPGLGEDVPYYHIEMNPEGAYYDGRKGMGGDWDFKNPRIGIQQQGSLNLSDDEDAGWTLEVAIPFAQIDVLSGHVPGAGEEWLFHLARYDYAHTHPNGKELSSTAHLSKVNFHLYGDWDILRFP